MTISDQTQARGQCAIPTIAIRLRSTVRDATFCHVIKQPMRDEKRST